MLAALAASGQTPSSFARARGIAPHRVSYWRARLEERSGARVSARGGGFVTVAMRDEAQVRTDAPERRVEVRLPNGRVVTFAGTWDAAAIAPWLHALDGAP
jgi:transposase-like protein